MATKIVGIHGLANKPPAEILSEWWQEAIEEGLVANCGRTPGRRPEFAMTYWADRLYDAPQNPDTMTEAYRPSVVPPTRHKKHWWDDYLRGALAAAGGALDAIQGPGVYSAVRQAVLKAKLQDLFQYYNDEAVRTELRGRLEESLLLANRTGETRLMVISHSMGTIIAYDVLREIGRKYPNFRVQHWITIGSPLGMATVKHNIEQEYDLARTPTVVGRWSNFADRRDPVAIDTSLTDDYAPNADGVAVVDHAVINDWAKLRHKSFGYLRCPEVSEAIREWL